MRANIFCLIVLALAASAVPAQQKRSSAPADRVPAQVPAKSSVPAELSEIEWKTLSLALDAEDWERSAALAKRYLENLRTENEKKQLARLRYIYLYSLAGKIHLAGARKNAADAERAWIELDNAVAAFVGREVILPPRSFAADCGRKLNFICPVRNDPRAFRTTATNKAGNAIHSFDYVVFDEPLDPAALVGKEIFLGGTLRKADYNEDPSRPWITRLFFDKAFASTVK